MKRCKAVLKKLFFLPGWLTIAISIPSLIFVFRILSLGDTDSFRAYLSYLLSAYGLIISGTLVGRWVSSGSFLIRKIKSLKPVQKYTQDIVFRSKVSLYGGFTINLCYVGINLISGLRYRSIWFLSLSIYYLLLAWMRFLLLRYVQIKPIKSDPVGELRRYRACGFLLVLMNQALIGIVFYIVYRNQNFSYRGMLIYAMAAYAFYMMIMAVINVLRYRKYDSPILSATRIVSLTAALVSMLSLETAMLSRFGGEDSSFRQIMTASSGGVICLLVLGLALTMIVKANRALRKYKM